MHSAYFDTPLKVIISDVRLQNTLTTVFSFIQPLIDTKGKLQISNISPGPGRIYPKFFLGLCLGSYIHPVSSEFVETDMQHEQASCLLSHFQYFAQSVSYKKSN
jgi:hypothetical protein